MKRSMSLVAIGLAVFAPVAGAYEYPLHFTPNPGYRGLLVAGYHFEGNEVVGNCSYYTVSGSSGKGGGGRGTIHNYDQTCRWDLHGNLLSVTPGAPVIPAPLYIQDTRTVYAVDANGDYTGTDTERPEGGFINTPGSHYSWLTPMNNAVLQQEANTLYTQVVTLKSDGDVPVNIRAVVPSALQGRATLNRTTCIGQINVDTTCSIIVTYDATALKSPTGLAFDILRIDLTSDAGDGHDFVQKFTIVLLPKLK